MSNPSEIQQSKFKLFRELHESGCFIIANPWNRGSAQVLQSLGFKALATTSAGLGFAHAIPDRVGAISLEMTLSNITEIVEATPLPVNADFQEGFADGPESLVRNVQACIQTGVCGLSIEDATGQDESPLFPFQIAVERMQAARKAIDASKKDVLLTGRCEAWLTGHPTPFKEALTRLTAYAEAGADCLYAPGVSDPKEIKELVDAIHPKPLNVLMGKPGHDLQTLAELGVRRISVGSAFARVAWGAFLRAAQDVSGGSFEQLSQAASFEQLNEIFESSNS